MNCNIVYHYSLAIQTPITSCLLCSITMPKSNIASIEYSCLVCNKTFPSQRALSVHVTKSLFCIEFGKSKTFSISRPQLHIAPDQNLSTTFVKENNTAEMLQLQTSNDNPESNDNFDNFDDHISLKETLETSTDNENMEQDDDNSKNVYKSGYIQNLQHEITLLKILNRIGTPLYAYNEIMKWAYNAHVANYKFDTKNKTYHQVVNHLEGLLNMEGFRPKNITVKLWGDEKETNVVVFNVPTLLASLFNDTELNQCSNLVVNSTNRFGKYIPKDNRLGEVNSGWWYNTAYNNMVQDPDNDFLCPLILSNDKTTISDMGELHVDAIFMTTSIFNTKVRYAAPIKFCNII